MKELYEKGVATHLGPEPCVRLRKGPCEASVGAHVGRANEPRKIIAQGADVFDLTEGNRVTGVIASQWSTLRGQRPRHAWKLIAREPGDPVIGHSEDGAEAHPGNPKGAIQW